MRDDLPLQIGLAGLAGLAVIGFLVGTGSGPPLENPLLPTVAEEEGSAPAARSYSELRTDPPASGHDWTLERDKLIAPDEGLGTKADALEKRADRRAYDGAPPTVPHPVAQQAASECLACHEDGLRARDRLATAMPHDDYASCTQCHVVMEGPVPGELLPPDATYAANSFAGLESPIQGPRAWSIAPPQVPHHTQMRENCVSCHGPNGQSPMQSSHPDRQECSQCHAAPAAADLRGQ